MDKLVEELIKVIEQIEMNDPWVEQFIKFARSYDNKNDEEFILLLANFIEHIEKVKGMQIESEGFKKVISIRKKFNKSASDLSRRYKIAIKTPYKVFQPITVNPNNK